MGAQTIRSSGARAWQVVSRTPFPPHTASHEDVSLPSGHLILRGASVRGAPPTDLAADARRGCTRGSAPGGPHPYQRRITGCSGPSALDLAQHSIHLPLALALAHRVRTTTRAAKPSGLHRSSALERSNRLREVGTTPGAFAQWLCRPTRAVGGCRHEPGCAGNGETRDGAAIRRQRAQCRGPAAQPPAVPRISARPGYRRPERATSAHRDSAPQL